MVPILAGPQGGAVPHQDRAPSAPEEAQSTLPGSTASSLLPARRDDHPSYSSSCWSIGTPSRSTVARLLVRLRNLAAAALIPATVPCTTRPAMTDSATTSSDRC